jgi:hypothetical protein
MLALTFGGSDHRVTFSESTDLCIALFSPPFLHFKTSAATTTTTTPKGSSNLTVCFPCPFPLPITPPDDSSAFPVPQIDVFNVVCFHVRR